MTLPGPSASSAGSLASAPSTQARWLSAHLSAGPSAARRGKVSLTAPSRGSTASRIRRASAERRTVNWRVWLPPVKTRSELAVDKVIFELAGFVLGHGPAARGHAGFVHRLAAAADQMMPFRLRLAMRVQPVG